MPQPDAKTNLLRRLDNLERHGNAARVSIREGDYHGAGIELYDALDDVTHAREHVERLQAEARDADGH